MNRSLTRVLFVAWCVTSAAAGDGPARQSVPIPNASMMHISSAEGRPYDIYVHLPRNYADTTRRFPVLYLLDAQWDFPLVTAVYGEQYYDGFIPDAITVGVTWGGENPDYDALRFHDFTPTSIGGPRPSGNAPGFLNFLGNTLIPAIDAQFRTLPNDRTLMGSSLGGLFTLYAMLTKPEIFSRYVLTSPALGWDHEVLFAREKEFAQRQAGLRATMFMAIGGLEDTVAFTRFAEVLRSRGYSDFRMETRVIQETGHSGGKAEGFARGLQCVFARPEIMLDNPSLDRFAGSYRSRDGDVIAVARAGHHLVARAPGGGSVSLIPSSRNEFYVKGVYLFVRGIEDASGRITGVTVEHFEGTGTLDKVP